MKTRVKTFCVMALAASISVAAPATAKLVKLTVAGRVTSGVDGGNELADVTNGPGGYVEHFAPATVFGTAGSLAGAAIRFSFIYDTDDIDQPNGIAGVFDDQIGQWTYDAIKSVSIGDRTRQFLALSPGASALALTGTLGINDALPDGLSGNFTGFTAFGDVYSNYRTSGLSFAGSLPANFFSTDAVLPGNLPGPGFGFAGAASHGTGSFSFVEQTCFLTCSYKGATGNFALTAISFGAVPEPAAWAMLIAGFGFVGVASRRTGRSAVAA